MKESWNPQRRTGSIWVIKRKKNMFEELKAINVTRDDVEYIKKS